MVTGLNDTAGWPGPTGAAGASTWPAPSTWSARIGYGLTELPDSPAPRRRCARPQRPRSLGGIARRSDHPGRRVTSAAGRRSCNAGLGRMGMHEPISILLLACLATGLVGAVVPALAVRRSAAPREEISSILGMLVELVALAQAAAMGIETALEARARLPERRRFSASGARSIERVTPGDRRGTVSGGSAASSVSTSSRSSLPACALPAPRARASARASARSPPRCGGVRWPMPKAGRTPQRSDSSFPAIVLMLGFVVFLIYPAAVTLSHLL